MTANDAPEPFVASASDAFPGFYAYMAFDGGIGEAQRWLSSALPAWLKLDLGAGNAADVGSYAIETCSETARLSQAPKNWTLHGSNNDSDWDLLDTVSGAPAWSESEKREYTCDATGTYRYYRLSVSAVQDNTRVSIGELYLYEGGAPPAGTPWLYCRRSARIVA